MAVAAGGWVVTEGVFSSIACRGRVSDIEGGEEFSPMFRFRRMSKCHADPSFSFRVVMCPVALIGRVEIQHGSLSRTAKEINLSASDMVLVVGVASGCVELLAGDDRLSVSAGECVILDLSCAFECHVEEAALVVLALPRPVGGEANIPPLLHGSVIPPNWGEILIDHVRTTVSRSLLSPRERRTAIIKSSISYVYSFIAEISHSVSTPRLRRDDIVNVKIKNYLRAHVDQHEISVDSICKHLGVSRATLYRIFKPEGGVRKYIQSSRLEAVRRALLDPYDGRSIQKIAESCGFTDPSYFSHAFRRAYGCTARELRRLGSARATPVAGMGLCGADLFGIGDILTHMRTSRPAIPAHRR